MHRNGIRYCQGRAGARQLRLFAAASASACLLTAGATVLTQGMARAASLAFTVNTTADAHDTHPGDGTCADAAGQCSLRAALEEAAASPPGSTVHIALPAGTYDLTLGVLTLGSTTPLNITVAGAGVADTVVAATGRFRVMVVTAHATGLLQNLEITGGKAGPNSYGGGIFSQGVLTLAHDSLLGNTAGAGGGVDNAGGTLTVTGSTIKNNNGGQFGGGGIQNGGPKNVPGTVVVRSSTITGNVTLNEGGGIFSGQNGHPAAAGRAAAAPRRLCAPARCTAPRLAAAGGLVLHVSNSTVSGNRGSNGGGGIAAEDTATLTGSQVNNNTAGTAIGGGVLNVGTVTDSTISHNTADSGGAVEDFGLVMTITDATLDGNHGAADGGALDINQQITVFRSTIAGNKAGDFFFKGMGAAAEIGGGATLVVSDSTIAGNTTAPAGRGSIDNFGGRLTLSFATLSGSQGLLTGGGFNSATATILAGTGTTPNCAVSLSESAGYNLSTDSSCGLSKKTDLTGVNPMLKPLANNGGPTMTQGLPRSSPAVNAGGLPASSSCPAADQRGESRPWGPACDIGAYELHYKLCASAAAGGMVTAGAACRSAWVLAGRAQWVSRHRTRPLHV
jgi:CSLREA domain-containing protein